MKDFLIFQTWDPLLCQDILDSVGHWEDGRHDDVSHPVHSLATAALVHRAADQVLGRNWLPDPERRIALHINPPHTPGADWHTDLYWDDREWPPGGRFAYLFFCPQDVSLDMGPITVRYEGREHPVCGPAGTCLLMSQDVVHRASDNTSDRTRFLLRVMLMSGGRL